MRAALFVGLAAWKWALAVKGMRTAVELVKGVRAGPERSEELSKYIRAYILVNFVDAIKSLVDKEHYTNQLHHLVSGLGYLLDIRHGNDRTKMLTVVGLSSEVVAPFYQAYNLLKLFRLHEDSSRRPSVATKLCVLGALVFTCIVRVPLCFWLSGIAARDTFKYFYARDGQNKVQPGQEIQPWLMAPSAIGGMFILWLDITWIREWMIPKLFNSRVVK